MEEYYDRKEDYKEDNYYSNRDATLNAASVSIIILLKFNTRSILSLKIMVGMAVKFSWIFFMLCSSMVLAQNRVFEIIAASEDHKIFTELLELSNLDELLKEDNYHAVFAPDDNAFMTILSPEELDSIKLDEAGTLQNLIMNHIVTDTVEVNGLSGPHLPLYGNFINLFIDGAGNVLIYHLGSNNPTPNLNYSTNSEEVFVDAENGRVLWVVNNYIHNNCKSWDEVVMSASTFLYNAFIETELEDTIRPAENLQTFIVPSDEVIYEHIIENGGLEMTPFLDSFMRRHIIEGFYPLQKIYDDLTVTNWMGETIVFNVNNDQYFINDEPILGFEDGKNAVSLFINQYLDKQEITAIQHEELLPFSIIPNPAVDVIQFTSSQEIQNATALIYNSNGQFMLSKKLVDGVSHLDIASFDTGLYFVQFQYGTYTKTIKFIKQD